MRKYLKQWLKSNVPGAQVTSDQSGIYVVKGEAETYPCVVAHIDEVHNERNNSYRVVVSGDYIFGYNVDSMKQQGIGADDKNGIWVAMQCLLKYDVMKVALFVGEEIGCVGSGQANMSFFDDCRFVIQCDRRGSSDFITSASGWELCDDKFTSKFDMGKFGYKATSGMMTDVMELKSRNLGVAACNLSCGYYNPHTSEETTIFSELENCRDLVFHIIDTVVDAVPHEASRSYSSYDSFYNYGSSYYGGYARHGYGYGEYTEDEEIEQFNEMQDYMWQEIQLDPEGFDIYVFYDTWKSAFPALTAADFDDALQGLLAYGAGDDSEAVVG